MILAPPPRDGEAEKSQTGSSGATAASPQHTISRTGGEQVRRPLPGGRAVLRRAASTSRASSVGESSTQRLAHDHRGRAATSRLEQVMKQLHKLIDVIKVTDLTDDEPRGARAGADQGQRRAASTGRRSCSIGRHLPGQGRRRRRPSPSCWRPPATRTSWSAMIELLRPFGIKEIVRTGRVAITRGPQASAPRRGAGSRRAGARVCRGRPRGDRASRTERHRKRRERRACRRRSTTTRTPTSASSRARTIAIIGYGSQGHAHALNLKDSGRRRRRRALRGLESRWAKAEDDGLKVAPVAEAAEAGDVIMILLPDQTQARSLRDEIEPHLTGRATR